MRESLGRLPRREVSFNYLGQLDQALPLSSWFRAAREGAGAGQSAAARRSHVLQINGGVLDGRLQLGFAYSAAVHQAATIAALADRWVAALRGLLAHCLLPGVGGYTPSDFPLAGLDQAALDRLTAGARDVEDVYPLSRSSRACSSTASRRRRPMSTWCSSPARWQSPIRRRCVGAWQPRRRAPPDPAHRPRAGRRRAGRCRWSSAAPTSRWPRLDLAPLSAGGQEARLEAYLAADRARGFDLARPPLMRLALLRRAEAAYSLRLDLSPSAARRLVHLAGPPRGLRPLRGAHAAAPICALPLPRPYRDYIAWLEQQDLAAAESVLAARRWPA